ncbi:MAG: hypothetical protein RR069_04765 [Oscillospiraceae bacterium]
MTCCLIACCLVDLSPVACCLIACCLVDLSPYRLLPVDCIVFCEIFTLIFYFT